jgi:hypothetical protein
LQCRLNGKNLYRKRKAILYPDESFEDTPDNLHHLSSQARSCTIFDGGVYEQDRGTVRGRWHEETYADNGRFCTK